MKNQKNNAENKIPLFDASGKKQELLELDKDMASAGVNHSLLYQAVNMYAANKRRGTSSSKTRGDVEGSGKKPWRQKGTGRARVGSVRNPVWRHGGIAFGPHPRSYYYALPKKLKRTAFFASLNSKLQKGKFVAVEDINLESPKTKILNTVLLKLKLNGKILLLSEKCERNMMLAARNLKRLALKNISEATPEDVLLSDQVVITRSALKTLNNILKERKK